MTGAVPLGATLLCSEQAAVTAAVTAAGVGAKVESRYKDGRWCASRRRPAQQPSPCQGACVVGTFFSRACARDLAAALYRYAATIVELPSRGWLRIREDLAAKLRKKQKEVHVPSYPRVRSWPGPRGWGPRQSMEPLYSRER